MEDKESINENINNSSNKELEYSEDFKTFLETIPNASNILKDTQRLNKNIFEMDISIFGGKEEILKRRRKVPDYGVYN